MRPPYDWYSPRAKRARALGRRRLRPGEASLYVECEREARRTNALMFGGARAERANSLYVSTMVWIQVRRRERWVPKLRKFIKEWVAPVLTLGRPR